MTNAFATKPRSLGTCCSEGFGDFPNDFSYSVGLIPTDDLVAGKEHIVTQ